MSIRTPTTHPRAAAPTSPLYDEIVSRRRATPIFDQVAAARPGRHSVALPSAASVTYADLHGRRELRGQHDRRDRPEQRA